MRMIVDLPKCIGGVLWNFLGKFTPEIILIADIFTFVFPYMKLVFQQTIA